MSALLHASAELAGLELDEEGRQFLGKGYSSIVYRVPVKGSGTCVVKKVSHSEGLPKLVNTIIFGNPLDLIATEEAVRTAYFRRRVFSSLVYFWTRGTIGVANAIGYGFDDEARAYYLVTEYVQGKGPRFVTPFSKDGNGGLEELISNVMEPLREHFLEINASDWQLNYRNSRSVANFIRGKKLDEEVERWFMVDLESGVPALAVMPVPKPSYMRDFWRYFRSFPSFDDVDIPALQAYLDENADDLAGFLGSKRFSELESDLKELDAAQSAWESMSRTDKYINHLLKKEIITAEQAQVLNHSKARLYMYMSAAAMQATASYLSNTLISNAARLLRFAGRSLRTMVSPAYGQKLGSEYVQGRLEDWVQEGIISEENATSIIGPLQNGDFRTRFGGLTWHMGPVWGLSKVTEVAIPSMLVANEMYWQAGVAVPLLAFYGVSPLLRGLHTLGYAAIARGVPKTALATSLLPIAGNFSFVFQMASDAYREGMRELSSFFIIDTFRKIASSPITFLWGGKGTLLDYRLNEFASRLVSRNK